MSKTIYLKWNVDRNNFKWNINELLRLEREYDLLELNVVEIAKLHQRTSTAIAMKLQSEGIISNFKVARGYNTSFSDDVYDNEGSDTSSEYIPSESEYASDSDSDYSPEYFKSYAKNNDPSHVNITIYDSDSDSDSSVEIIENSNVTQRVDKLETSVSNMEGMLTKMYNFMTSNSSSLNMGYNM
jgi:hypothetical protein